MKRQFSLLSVMLMLVAAVCATVIAVTGYYKYSTGAVASKLFEIEKLMDRYFVEDYDKTAAADAAANAVIASTDDPWSYYIPASAYAEYLESAQNAYVGIGITIDTRGENGFSVTEVQPEGPAGKCGILAGDIITSVDGTDVVGSSVDQVRSMIRGNVGTTVNITIIRGEEVLTVQAVRESIATVVSEYRMLNRDIGYIKIKNFEANSSNQTLEGISELMQQGAKALVFDVRFNPGGKKDEMVRLLDYLLPEGVVFRSVDYDGKVLVSNSDAICLDIPMAVLINESSCSAAEFFAAALQEYHWAQIIGEATTGKGNYQVVFPLSDGSAVGLSIGRYYTPNGNSLAGVGVTPDMSVAVTDEERVKIMHSMLADAEDPQLDSAVQFLQNMLF